MTGPWVEDSGDILNLIPTRIDHPSKQPLQTNPNIQIGLVPTEQTGLVPNKQTPGLVPYPEISKLYFNHINHFHSLEVRNQILKTKRIGLTILKTKEIGLKILKTTLIVPKFTITLI